MHIAPNFRRIGVISGFALDLGAGLVPVFASWGVLFAQGTMYRPGAVPTLPAMPDNSYRHLAYNSTSGFYWTTSTVGTSAGDAVLGWAVSRAGLVVAVSRQVMGVGETAITGSAVPAAISSVADASGQVSDAAGVIY